MSEGVERVFSRREGVVARHVAGETVLVPIKGRLADLQRVFTLNEVGACIWELLDGTRDLRAVATELEESFEVSRSEAEADVNEFVNQLLEADLITAV